MHASFCVIGCFASCHHHSAGCELSTEIARNALDSMSYVPPSVPDVSRSAAGHSLPTGVDAAAHSDAPVLIVGKGGMQAEHIARLVHGKSVGRSGRFITLNCTAIAPEALPEEIFGRNDSTGAGLLDAAAGGTLFLNDIGALAVNAQMRLLRDLRSAEGQERSGTTARSARVRIIASTHSSLKTLINGGGEFNQSMSEELSVIDVSGSDAGANGSGGSGAVPAGEVDAGRSTSSNGAWSTTSEAATISDDVLMMPFTEARALAIELFDKAFLSAALARNSGNIARTARSLGLHRQSLQKLMGRRGIKVIRPVSAPRTAV